MKRSLYDILIDNESLLMADFFQKKNVERQMSMHPSNLVILIIPDKIILFVVKQLNITPDILFGSSIFKDILFNHFGYIDYPFFASVNNNKFNFMRLEVEIVKLKETLDEKLIYIIKGLLVTDEQRQKLNQMISI